MKAQAMGAIPVTSRFSDSALPETCGRFDLGPAEPEDGEGAGGEGAEIRDSGAEEEEERRMPTQSAPGEYEGLRGRPMRKDPARLAAFADAVVAAASLPADQLAQWRRLMKAWARERFSWARTARVWIGAFREREQRVGGCAADGADREFANLGGRCGAASHGGDSPRHPAAAVASGRGAGAPDG
jgi:hypothetical protein